MKKLNYAIVFVSDMPRAGQASPSPTQSEATVGAVGAGLEPARKAPRLR